VWTPCPLFHVGALVPLIGCVALGIPFVTQRQFAAAEALAAVGAGGGHHRRSRSSPPSPTPSSTTLVPHHRPPPLQQVLTLATGGTGSGPSGSSLRPGWCRPYGMTELCGVSASSPTDESDEDRLAWTAGPSRAWSCGSWTRSHADPSARGAG